MSPALNIVQCVLASFFGCCDKNISDRRKHKEGFEEEGLQLKECSPRDSMAARECSSQKHCAALLRKQRKMNSPALLFAFPCNGGPQPISTATTFRTRAAQSVSMKLL